MTRTTMAVAATGFLALVACDQAMVAEPAEPVSGLPSPAQAACMEAVAAETGNANVTVLRSSIAESGAEVVIGVGDARAPWRCRTAGPATVVEVESLVG